MTTKALVEQLDSNQLRQYKKDYSRGWYASENWMGNFPTPLDRADERGEGDAWYDGYLDSATGREKWHMLHCANHNTCGEG